MHARVSLLICLLTAAALAGCVADPSASDSAAAASPPVDVYDAIRALMADVPCDAGPVGPQASSNLLHLTNLSMDQGLHAELDMARDRGLLAWARYGAGGFELVSTADPLNLEVAGQYLVSGGALDVKFSPDNQTVFVGHGWGVDIVDVQDAEEPAHIGNWTFPAARPWETLRNAHMLFTAHIADADWLFVAPNANSGVHILAIEGEPGAVTLRKVAETLPVQGGPLGPHDMWVGRDAVTGSFELYSADGFEGWSAWNVDDPTMPALITRVLPLEPYHGYTHTIQAAQVGDRRLVATIAEVGHNALKIYDATILAAPVLLGTWQADTQGDPTAPEHNLNIVDGKLIVAHYQRGFYVFDLAAMPAIPLTGFAQLQPMGHWTGDPDATQGPLGFNGVWDVVVDQGVLYASDITQLRVLGFGCFAVGDQALFSVG